jgi:hypothetical protein
MYHDAIAEKLEIVTQKLTSYNQQHDGLPPMPPCNGCYAFYCPCEEESHTDDNCRHCVECWCEIYTCLNSENFEFQGDTKSLTSLVAKLQW